MKEKWKALPKKTKMYIIGGVAVLMLASAIWG
jgi:hypothetical protein